MPYDEELEMRIEDIIYRWLNISKRKMFGGVCFMLNGNLCFGVLKHYLIVRLGKEKTEEKLKLENVLPFDITGRAMRGWVMVDRNGYQADEQLRTWLEAGKDFCETLPKKRRGGVTIHCTRPH